MHNFHSSRLRNGSFVLLGVLLVITTAVSFATYRTQMHSNPYITFLAVHHITIMAASLLTAVAFGFLLSQLYYVEIQKQKRETTNILGIVLLFLSQEERAIIDLLVQNRGNTNQSEIARLPQMNRVKAHRAIQKMQEKQLIEIVPHGKIRKVKLKENLLQILLEKTD